MLTIDWMHFPEALITRSICGAILGCQQTHTLTYEWVSLPQHLVFQTSHLKDSNFLINITCSLHSFNSEKLFCVNCALNHDQDFDKRWWQFEAA